MNQPLLDTLQRYLAGEAAHEELALLRPYQVAACLRRSEVGGEDLCRFMLVLHKRGDQPTLLRRLVRYAQRREPDVLRRYESAAAPLFSTLNPTPLP